MTMAAVRIPTLYEFNDGILALLECPVCLKFMKSPINQCENSHCICSQCASQVVSCPTCRGDIIEMRCLPLEHLTERVLIKCEFMDLGCNKRFLLKDMPDHARVCPYRSYKCLPGLQNGCDWTGKRSDIYAHVSLRHDRFKLLPGEDEVIARAFVNADFSVEFDECYIISFGGDAFWLREMCRPVAGKFYIAVQYIGPETTASTYTYTVDLSSRKSRYLYQAVTHSDFESLDDIINAGSCACVSIPILQSMVSEANFKYDIQLKGFTP